MDSSNKYITKVQQYKDTEDYYIEIPEEIINELNWQEGDEISWTVDNEQIILTNYSKKTRGEYQSVNISDATQEDYQDFWYNSESEGQEYTSNRV